MSENTARLKESSRKIAPDQSLEAASCIGIVRPWNGHRRGIVRIQFKDGTRLAMLVALSGLESRIEGFKAPRA
jgi:hypothetical protein